MHETFMNEALRLATLSIGQSGGPFGAVVVRDGRIVGRGHNRVVADCDPSAHAEIVALRHACRTLGTFHLPGCALYSSCEPCPMCLGAAYWARIERIYYAASRDEAAAAGFDDALLYAELARPMTRRRLPMQRLLAEAGRQPFLDWLASPNRVPY